MPPRISPDDVSSEGSQESRHRCCPELSDVGVFCDKNTAMCGPRKHGKSRRALLTAKQASTAAVQLVCTQEHFTARNFVVNIYLFAYLTLTMHSSLAEPEL